MEARRNETAAEPGVGVVLSVVLLLFAAPIVAAVLFGVAFYQFSGRPSVPTVTSATAVATPAWTPAAGGATSVATLTPATPPQSVTLNIQADGSFLLDGLLVSSDELPAELVRRSSMDPQALTVQIIRDPEASDETVSWLLEFCEENGITTVKWE